MTVKRRVVSLAVLFMAAQVLQLIALVAVLVLTALLGGCATTKGQEAPPLPELPLAPLTPPPAKADGMVRAIPDLSKREASFAQTWRALGLPESGVCMDESKAMNAGELRVWAEGQHVTATANEALLQQSRGLMWRDGWEERRRRLELEEERVSFMSRHEHTIWLVAGITVGVMLGKVVFSQ